MPNGVNPEILTEELAQIVQSAFENMLDLQVNPSGMAWYPSSDRLTAMVHLSGSWNGAVLLECDPEQACQFTGRFLSIDPPPVVNDIVRDVLEELANIIGGNLKCALGTGIELSMPTLIEGGSADVNVGKQLGFECVCGPFWTTIIADPK